MTGTHAPEMMDGARLITAERLRQVDVEGYDPEHDRWHLADAFVKAAGAYLGLCRWPWTPESFKPADGDGYYVSRDLEKAGALIAAALDRLNGTRPSRPVVPSSTGATGDEGVVEVEISLDTSAFDAAIARAEVSALRAQLAFAEQAIGRLTGELEATEGHLAVAIREATVVRGVCAPRRVES